MFNVTRIGPNRIDVEISGKIDSDEMSAGLDDLICTSGGMKDGHMLLRVSDIAFPTLAAMSVEFVRLPSLFALIRKVRRIAVLADREWIRTISEIKGALIPGLDIEGFGPDEEAEAEAWLTQRS